MSRPSEFTQDIADEICEHIADGKSLRDICLGANMPARSTVFKWLSVHQSFADQYARARESQADALADDIVAIADEDPLLAFSTEGRGENSVDVVRVDAAAVAHQRNRIEARKWVASKLKPKKYGDKLEVGGTGEGGALVLAISTKPKESE